MKHKIIKCKITGALLSQLFMQGWEKTIITRDALPDDAELFNLEYDDKDNTICLYFLSHKQGEEIPEGASIQNIEATLPNMMWVETIDRQKVRDAIINILKAREPRRKEGMDDGMVLDNEEAFAKDLLNELKL